MAVKISSFGLVAMASSRADIAGILAAGGTVRRTVPLALAFFGLIDMLCRLIHDFCLSFIFFCEDIAAWTMNSGAESDLSVPLRLKMETLRLAKFDPATEAKPVGWSSIIVCCCVSAIAT